MEKEGNNLFQVNLKGMIALLSEHIYSNPNTFVRELLQNCVDAITALRNIDENYKGRIDVFLNEDKTVVFRDNGIGLKEEEVYRFLTVIGESSKRDTPDIGVVLWHKYVTHETIAYYVEGIEWLKSKGFKIYGVVIDGMKGLPQALKPIKVLMCQFHQILTARRHLTKTLI